jgi:hypothetical protein
LVIRRIEGTSDAKSTADLSTSCCGLTVCDRIEDVGDDKLLILPCSSACPNFDGESGAVGPVHRDRLIEDARSNDPTILFSSDTNGCVDSDGSVSEVAVIYGTPTHSDFSNRVDRVRPSVFEAELNPKLSMFDMRHRGMNDVAEENNPSPPSRDG